MPGRTHVAKIFRCINLTLSYYFWAHWLEAGRHSTDCAKIFRCINLTLSHYFWAQWLEAGRHTAWVCVRIRLFIVFYGWRYEPNPKLEHIPPPPQPPLFSARDPRISSDAEEDARTSRQALRQTQGITLTQALTREGRPQLSV
ncbi:unnamed protein product [Meganyctiphanes norvegica]|uniref:Uncharacterized protein n=1 Tax=Meganyctiphanes norvegica TaxID=48144 RepID=A0AAV2QSJ7_MEGNR